MIKIEHFYAVNDEELQASLNEISGRVITVQYEHDDRYKVIYETHD